jgi:Holliday junction resolvasome RuvABC DNA-binding subunit
MDADTSTSVAATVTSTRAHVGALDVTSGASAGAHVGVASELAAAIVRAQAKAALTGLGWKPAIAHAAVVTAAATKGKGVSLERLIFEALRRCPAPKA